MERKVSAMISMRCIASLHQRCRTAGGDPGGLHLRETADLADAAEDEGEAVRFSGGEAGLGRCEGVVEEDFVDDQG